MGYASPRSIVLTDLYVRLLKVRPVYGNANPAMPIYSLVGAQESLNEYAYSADIAGLHWSAEVACC
jgi:hypothetical protein